MALTLVVMAAGLGTRFGGPKQIEPLGPAGATLLDYSIYDAVRAGFGTVVLVIRDDLEAAVRDTIGARWGKSGGVPLIYARQRLSDVPAGVTVPPRAKPWGTGHAGLAAAAEVGGPFAGVNGDGLHGQDALGRAVAVLGAGRPGQASA